MDVLARTIPAPRSQGPSAAEANPCRDRPRLSVLVVNYHGWEDTVRLVRQLGASRCQRQGVSEVVVVDNHSPPHPLIGWLRRASPGVSLRRWKSNRGFARAVNEGCRLARGDWLLLLNPDTCVGPDFLDVVLARAEALEPRAGIVGFRLHDADGTRQLSSGPFPGLFGTLTGLLLPRRRRKYGLSRGDEPGQVDWVTGCCLLIRRDCFTDLGGLDPAFFLYYEDVDLCLRARQRGWSVWFDPGACVVHHSPLHSRAVPPHLRLVTRHALLTYARKHWPGWQLSALGGVIRIEALARRLLAWWRGDADAYHAFAELGQIVSDIRAGRSRQARARLLRIIRHEEEQRRAATTLDRHPVAQANRSAAGVPEQHPAA